MSYLFYSDIKNNIVLHPDCVKLSPELGLLNDKEILFIILAFDYNSIYRQFPERQRVSKAIWHVFGDNKPELLLPEKRKKNISTAIEIYKSLQYNRNIELIEMYNNKIDELIILLEVETSNIGIKNATESIDRFKKLIKGIEQEVLEEKLIEGQIKGKGELSWLERMQQNQKAYNSMIAKKQ